VCSDTIDLRPCLLGVLQVKRDMEQRVDALDNQEVSNQNKAELILEHANLVEAAIQIIRSAVASGMNWDDLGALIKQQQQAGHPVASAIVRVKLETNQISLKLASANLLGQANAEATEIIDVDIGLSAHRNASIYFSKKKETHVKYDLTCCVLPLATRNCVTCWHFCTAQVRENCSTRGSSAGVCS